MTGVHSRRAWLAVWLAVVCSNGWVRGNAPWIGSQVAANSVADEWLLDPAIGLVLDGGDRLRGVVHTEDAQYLRIEFRHGGGWVERRLARLRLRTVEFDDGPWLESAADDTVLATRLLRKWQGVAEWLTADELGLLCGLVEGLLARQAYEPALVFADRLLAAAAGKPHLTARLMAVRLEAWHALGQTEALDAALAAWDRALGPYPPHALGHKMRAERALQAGDARRALEIVLAVVLLPWRPDMPALEACRRLAANIARQQGDSEFAAWHSPPTTAADVPPPFHQQN
jgi:hypothetical protein